MTTPTADGEKALAAALGRVPSGLFILTARRGDRETGMLASWVQQCSFSPPLVVVGFQAGRYLLEWLTDGAAFTLNVLGESQKNLMAHFGKGFGPDEPAFDGLAVRRDGDSAPVLTDAHAYLDCRVSGRLEPGGDHVLVVGRVVAGAVLHDARPATHVRRSGLHY